MSDSAAIKGLGSYLTSSFREFAISRGLTQEIINDYAAIKAERDALATENAALSRYFSASAGAVDNWNSWADTEDKLSCAPEIPDTDAYLNSVRAEGVEMFAKHWENNCAHDDTFVGKKAKQFAAKLRAGKDGE